jgi:hypothetical protein
MDIPSSVCKQLAAINKDYRYGIGILPGQGQVAFLAMLVDRQHAGGDSQDNRGAHLSFHVRDLGDRLIRLYDKDGSSPCVVPADKTAVLIAWPGQEKNIGNKAVVSGQHASWLARHGKPLYDVELDRENAARENGRDIDSYIDGAAHELSDMWMHWGNKESGRDPLFDKEDVKKAINSPQGVEWQKTHEHDKSVSIEAITAEENGFKI